MEKKDLAIDDDILRQQNSKKVVDGIDNLGKGMASLGRYAEDSLKKQKQSYYIGLSLSIIFLLMIGGGLIFAFAHGGISSIFDAEASERRFECQVNGWNDTVRSYGDVKDIYDMNGTCTKLKVR